MPPHLYELRNLHFIAAAIGVVLLGVGLGLLLAHPRATWLVLWHGLIRGHDVDPPTGRPTRCLDCDPPTRGITARLYTEDEVPASAYHSTGRWVDASTDRDDLDQFVAEQSTDPEFADAYERAKTRIDQLDNDQPASEAIRGQPCRCNGRPEGHTWGQHLDAIRATNPKRSDSE